MLLAPRLLELHLGQMTFVCRLLFFVRALLGQEAFQNGLPRIQNASGGDHRVSRLTQREVAVAEVGHSVLGEALGDGAVLPRCPLSVGRRGLRHLLSVSSAALLRVLLVSSPNSLLRASALGRLPAPSAASSDGLLASSKNCLLAQLRLQAKRLFRDSQRV